MSDYRKKFHDLMNRYSITFGRARILSLTLEKTGDFEDKEKVMELIDKLIVSLQDTNEEVKTLRDSIIEDLKL